MASLVELPPDERVAEHFNRSAHSYGNDYQARSPAGHFFRRRQEIILQRLAHVEDRGKLLDLGCGPGLMTEPCLKIGFTFSGIDISDTMIAECRKKYSRRPFAEFLVGNLHNLPFLNAYFDVVLCMGALEYVPVNEQPKAISEMNRVTRSDGLLILSCLNKMSLYWMFYDHVYAKVRVFYKKMRNVISRIRHTSHSYDDTSDDVAMHKFTEQSCRHLLESNGFATDDTVYYGVNIFLHPLDKRFPRLAALVSERLEHLSKGRLSWLGMGFVVVARKIAEDSPAVVENLELVRNLFL